MERNYDLIIAGGGLAGGCLALALQPSRFRIGLVEAIGEEMRRASPAGDRALALANGTVRTLDDLGVWHRVAHEATPIRHIHVSDRGHFGKVRLCAEKEGVEALGYVITARILEQAVDAGVREAAVDRICPARVTGLKAGASDITVRIEQGGESADVSARLLVGADGSDSSIRRLLEIGQKSRDYGQTAVVTLVQTGKEPQGTAYERFTPAGPLAFLPAGGSRCSVVWTLTREDAEIAMTQPEPRFLERLQACFGYRLGRLELLAPRRAFPLKLIQAQKMVSSRAVLLGNAMHQLHPVAGQGFNLGLRDVVELAEMLVDHGRGGGDPGDKGLLAEYAKRRAVDHRRVIGFTDTVVRLFSNQWPALTAARNAGLLALDHTGAAKRILARYAMGLGGRLPRLRLP